VVIKPPSIYDVPSGQTLDLPVGTVERLTFNAPQMSQPSALAYLLGRLQDNLIDAFRFGLNDPQSAGVYFQGQPFGTGGAQVKLSHGLKRPVFGWTVVRWTGASAGASLVEVSSDSTYITFASYVTGTATIRIF